MAEDVAAHEQAQSHKYTLHFPPHPARANDPNYRDFDAYHRKTRATARCLVGERIGFDWCRDGQGQKCVIDASGQMSGMELHHSHIEFSLQNGIDLKALEIDYPGVSDPAIVGAWVESAANLMWLCAWHHRGAGGAHTAAYADWEASKYVLGLIS